MRGFDWLVVIVMAVVGWLLVSFLLNRSKPQGSESGDSSQDVDHGRTDVADADFSTVARLPAPRDDRAARDASDLAAGASLSPASSDQSALLSLDEIGRAWSTILGVRTDANGAEIEAAYHAKLAECDRVRFDSNASSSSRQMAEQQRARVNQAYEFIRPARA